MALARPFQELSTRWEWLTWGHFMHLLVTSKASKVTLVLEVLKGTEGFDLLPEGLGRINLQRLGILHHLGEFGGWKLSRHSRIGFLLFWVGIVTPKSDFRQSVFWALCRIGERYFLVLKPTQIAYVDFVPDLRVCSFWWEQALQNCMPTSTGLFFNIACTVNTAQANSHD